MKKFSDYLKEQDDTKIEGEYKYLLLNTGGKIKGLLSYETKLKIKDNGGNYRIIDNTSFNFFIPKKTIKSIDKREEELVILLIDKTRILLRK